MGGVAGMALAGVLLAACSGGGGGSADEGFAVDFSLMPIAYGSQCGYVDPKGKMVINPQFDGAGFFSRSGVAPVRSGGKWGLVDRKGSYVVNPQFDQLTLLGNSGDMLVRVGNQWGTVDRKGSYIINPQFDQMSPFDAQNRALVRSGGKYGFVDRKGGYTINPQFDAVYADVSEDGSSVTYFSNGLAAAAMEGKWGFIDDKGQWVINPQYESVGKFDSSGLAPVMIVEVEETVDEQAATSWTQYHDQQAAYAASWGYTYQRPERPDFTRRTEKRVWGYIDKTGKIVITPQYVQAGNFGSGGLAPVMVGESWGYIDKSGTLKINPQFENVTPFEDGPGGAVARVAVRGDGGWRWGLIDSSGTYKINPQFSSIGPFRNGHAIVASAGKMGLVDGSGKYVINPQYDGLLPVAGSRDYLFIRGQSRTSVQMGRVTAAGKEESSVSGGMCDMPY